MAVAGECWARLVSLGSPEDIVQISTQTFTIGRSSDNDLSFPDNKLVSQTHCKIAYEDDGAVSLTDSSTNGTQVDGNKVKQRKAELHHGDEIHIVFKKNSAQSNIAYLFEQLDKKLADTLESTQEYEDPVEYTEVPDPDEPAAKQPKLSADVVPSESAAKLADKPEPVDEIEETLLCSICQELLHDCVSLQPCMHTFCAGCFSQWMKSSKSCPTCRKKASSVAQNHILRNLIEVYLKSHPEKQRPKADLEELNKHNVIKVPNMKLDGRTAEVDYNTYSDGSDYSRSSDDSDVDGGTGAIPFYVPPTMNMNVPVCRQCPGYQASRAAFGLGAGAASDSDGQSTAAGDAGSVPDYQCMAGGQAHLVCYCCMEMFPDRRLTANTPPVTCEMCSGMFCHLYWRCRRMGCLGCLTKLKDMNFEDSVLNNILLQNPFESDILKEYARGKSLTIRDIVMDACTKLDRGDFMLNNDFGCNFAGRGLRADSVICHKCGVKAFRQLAYFYRKDIPADDLPDAVTRKEDCYWGKNCRTQKKPAHAAKWNHICEQTRFAS